MHYPAACGGVVHATPVAKDDGFKGALIGGVTAYGWTVRTIKPGDLLLIDRHMAPGLGDGLDVISLDDRMLAKRLQLRAAGSLLIKSNSPIYGPDTLTQAEELRVLGKIVWTGRKVA